MQQPHPTTNPDSPFNLLINDLQAMRDRRQVEANARQARMAQEAAGNRRQAHVQQQQRQQVKRRALAKAAPPDFDRIARQQAQIETAMRDTAARAKQNAVRDRLAGCGFRQGRTAIGAPCRPA